MHSPGIGRQHIPGCGKGTFDIVNSPHTPCSRGTPEEAAGTTGTPFDSFSSQQELAELAAQWPAARLVAIWNSLPGVPPVKKFKDHQDSHQPGLEAHPGPGRAPAAGA